MSKTINLAETPKTGFDARQLATDLFDTLRKKTSDRVGITRESFGSGEQIAHELIREVAEEYGLTTTTDAVSNTIISLPGREAETPYLACGSHLDSVPQGGNYDGAAGVIAALLALIRLHVEGTAPETNVKVIAIRGEESAWYGKSYVGSSALFGKLTDDDLALTHRTGQGTLADAMRSTGAEIDRIAEGARLLDPADVAGFVELHIEQGPVMVARQLPTAIVTGIRGNIRHPRIICRGEAGHSGAVPRWLRRDAVFAAAELITNLDEHWRVLLERGLDLVVTAGIIETDSREHSLSRIPGEVAFSFEVRSQSVDTLEAFYHLMQTECRQIEAKRKVTFEFDRRIDSAPARVDDRWIDRLTRASEKLGLPTEKVASGAGHDAAVFANEGIPAAMIFVRNTHGSHNPHEAMDIDDFMAGTDLLYQALVDLDT